MELTRRALLGNALAGPLALGMSSALSRAWAASADVLRGVVVINTLGGLFDPDAARPKGVTGSIDDAMVTDRSLRYARESGMTAVNITLGYVDGPADPFEHTVREIGIWHRTLERYADQLVHVRTANDILRAKAEGKTGVIFGFQNGVMIGNDASRAQLFADLGVRVFQITYNKAMQLGDGSLAPENRGLTPLGREVIERLNDCRVITDLSHSGQNTCLDAIRVSKRPISISHTGCRALVDNPRNKTDEELRLVAQGGGYVGIYFMPFLRAKGPARSEDLIAHIEHALNVCGEDHVGIGTDGDVLPIPDVEKYMERQRAWVAERVKAGIAAPGESDGAPFFVVDLTGPEQFRKLARLLSERGHSWTRIEKILGKNFLRVAREVWGA